MITALCLYSKIHVKSVSKKKVTFFHKLNFVCLVACLCIMYSRASTALNAICLNAIFPFAPFQLIFLATLLQNTCDSMFHVTCFVSCPPMEPRAEICRDLKFNAYTDWFSAYKMVWHSKIKLISMLEQTSLYQVLLL